MCSNQTFKSITFIRRNILSLSEFFEFFFHCSHSGLNIKMESAAGEDIGVDLRVREDSLPGGLGNHVTDVSVSARIVSWRSSDSPLWRQGGETGVISSGLVPLVVSVH